jgi:hypothetical protein
MSAVQIRLPQPLEFIFLLLQAIEISTAIQQHEVL